MNVTKETITPKKAMDWLKRNVHNRPLRTKYANRLASAITAKEWTLNGETIKFNGNGDLIDGQHRLNAIIIAGAPIDSYVVRGVPHEAFDTIDTGTPRAVRDVLARMGKAYYSHLATAIRVLGQLKGGKIGEGGWGTMTNTASVKLLEENPGLEKSVEKVSVLEINKLMSVGHAGCLHYMMSQAGGEELADKFWTMVASGEGLTKTMPAYLFRERLIENRSSSSTKLNKFFIIGIAIKAWNAFRASKPLKCLKYDGRETFPVVE